MTLCKHSSSESGNTAVAGLAAAFIAFFIFGFSDVLKGTAIPEIIASTDIGYNLSGALIGFTYFGFFSGTLSSVFTLKRVSAPRLLSFAVIIAVLGMLLFSFSNNIVFMFISAFMIGTGGGLIDVTANLTVRMTAEKEKLGARLNQLAFFHGAGAVLSPLFAGLVLSYAADWHFIYRFAGSFTAVIAVLVVFIVRKADIIKSSEPEEPSALSVTPKVALLGVILFFYMTLEAGISGWIVEYGRTVAGLSSRRALLALSLFFVLLTLGRFLSSFYVDRLGLHLSVLLNFIVILILAAFGVVYTKLFILLPLTGLFMAPVFPTMVAMISNELGNTNIRILGIFFSVAGIGGIFGPWMIGMLAKNFSLQTGFSLLMVFTICAITTCVLYRCVSGQKERI